MQIKLIIGLGNPGPSYYYQRHSIGFRVLDALKSRHRPSAAPAVAREGWDGGWRTKNNMELTQVSVHEHEITLIKPQTFMNSSGSVLPAFIKQGITPEQILVVHDELELPFGKIALKSGGSARGHNGLKSIIQVLGSDQFFRLRIGIGRPERKEDVPDYVLENFQEPSAQVEAVIHQAVELIESKL